MVSPHTIQLLTDLGEIREYKHTEYENDELQKALAIHGDILARLENPTKYTWFYQAGLKMGPMLTILFDLNRKVFIYGGVYNVLLDIY